MKTYHITIVDNTEGRTINFDSIMRDTIKRKEIFQLEFDVSSYKHVWGNRERPSPMEFINPGDILFIHANDEVNPLWHTFIDEKCKEILVICFSGAGVRPLSWNNPKHFACNKTINTVEDINNKWHLNDFLFAIINNEDNPFDKLIGYDQILEAKLELLHECLVPSGIPDELPEPLQFDIDSEKYQLGFREFTNGWRGKTDEDIFNPAFIEALTKLRICLLGS